MKSISDNNLLNKGYELMLNLEKEGFEPSEMSIIIYCMKCISDIQLNSSNRYGHSK